ncbi:uncharacterized protein [Aristolochia californica]|uniref:uncharacterized protein n=1 Tax=Aristolochia californica TaxID=171875 RepID=UPI0035DF416F
MEVPIISRISDFEAGFSRLQNPSFVSRIFGLSGIDEIAKLRTFWTWGALILAVLATFSSLLKRTKLLLFRLRTVNTVISQPLLHCDDYDDDNGDDDEESSCSSSCSEDSDSEEENEDGFLMPTAGKRGQSFIFVADSERSDENWSQTSNLKRRPRRLSDLSGDKGGESQFSTNVVKLWDGLGLGFKNSDRCGYISTCDFDRNESFFAGWSQTSQLSAPCPAGVDKTRSVALKFWDARMGPQTPAVVAEWEPPRREVVGIDANGVEKVYVSDDVGSVSVRNLRNVTAPSTDPDGLTWFDADAVIVGGDIDSPSSCPGVVTR